MAFESVRSYPVCPGFVFTTADYGCAVFVVRRNSVLVTHKSYKSKVAYQMSELIDQISQNKSELLKAEFSFFNDTLSSIVLISFIIFLIILKLLVFCG